MRSATENVAYCVGLGYAQHCGHTAAILQCSSERTHMQTRANKRPHLRRGLLGLATAVGSSAIERQRVILAVSPVAMQCIRMKGHHATSVVCSAAPRALRSTRVYLCASTWKSCEPCAPACSDALRPWCQCDCHGDRSEYLRFGELQLLLSELTAGMGADTFHVNGPRDRFDPLIDALVCSSVVQPPSRMAVAGGPELSNSIGLADPMCCSCTAFAFPQ